MYMYSMNGEAFPRIVHSQGRIKSSFLISSHYNAPKIKTERIIPDNSWDYCPIHTSILQNDFQKTKELLRYCPHFASVYAQNKFLPLHLAAIVGNIELCELILSYNPQSRNARTELGLTAETIARNCGHSELTEWFQNNQKLIIDTTIRKELYTPSKLRFSFEINHNLNKNVINTELGDISLMPSGRSDDHIDISTSGAANSISSHQTNLKQYESHKLKSVKIRQEDDYRIELSNKVDIEDVIFEANFEMPSLSSIDESFETASYSVKATDPNQKRKTTKTHKFINQRELRNTNSVTLPDDLSTSLIASAMKVPGKSKTDKSHRILQLKNNNRIVSNPQRGIKFDDELAERSFSNEDDSSSVVSGFCGSVLYDMHMDNDDEDQRNSTATSIQPKTGEVEEIEFQKFLTITSSKIYNQQTLGNQGKQLPYSRSDSDDYEKEFENSFHINSVTPYSLLSKYSNSFTPSDSMFANKSAISMASFRSVFSQRTIQSNADGYQLPDLTIPSYEPPPPNTRSLAGGILEQETTNKAMLQNAIEQLNYELSKQSKVFKKDTNSTLRTNSHEIVSLKSSPISKMDDYRPKWSEEFVTNKPDSRQIPKISDNSCKSRRYFIEDDKSLQHQNGNYLFDPSTIAPIVLPLLKPINTNSNTDVLRNDQSKVSTNTFEMMHASKNIKVSTPLHETKLNSPHDNESIHHSPNSKLHDPLVIPRQNPVQFNHHPRDILRLIHLAYKNNLLIKLNQLSEPIEKSIQPTYALSNTSEIQPNLSYEVRPNIVSSHKSDDWTGTIDSSRTANEVDPAISSSRGILNMNSASPSTKLNDKISLDNTFSNPNVLILHSDLSEDETNPIASRFQIQTHRLSHPNTPDRRHSTPRLLLVGSIPIHPNSMVSLTKKPIESIGANVDLQVSSLQTSDDSIPPIMVSLPPEVCASKDRTLQFDDTLDSLDEIDSTSIQWNVSKSEFNSHDASPPVAECIVAKEVAEEHTSAQNHLIMPVPSSKERHQSSRSNYRMNSPFEGQDMNLGRKVDGRGPLSLMITLPLVKHEDQLIEKSVHAEPIVSNRNQTTMRSVASELAKKHLRTSTAILEGKRTIQNLFKVDIEKVHAAKGYLMGFEEHHNKHSNNVIPMETHSERFTNKIEIIEKVTKNEDLQSEHVPHFPKTNHNSEMSSADRPSIQEFAVHGIGVKKPNNILNEKVIVPSMDGKEIEDVKLRNDLIKQESPLDSLFSKLAITNPVHSKLPSNHLEFVSKQSMDLAAINNQMQSSRPVVSDHPIPTPMNAVSSPRKVVRGLSIAIHPANHPKLPIENFTIQSSKIVSPLHKHRKIK